MYADPRFSDRPAAFYAEIRFLNKRLKYQKKGVLLRHSAEGIRRTFVRAGLNVPEARVPLLVAYFDWRADQLENVVKPNLRTLAEAKADYEAFAARRPAWACRIPTQTPRGSKVKVPLYFHATGNMVAEEALDGRSFDSLPTGPVLFTDGRGNLRQTLGREPDQAYPSLQDPAAICEFKEYFVGASGSKISDGIQLARGEGHELRGCGLAVSPRRIILFDGLDSLWGKSRPELCKALDLLEEGLIDAVFFGRQIFTDWPVEVASWPTLEKRMADKRSAILAHARERQVATLVGLAPLRQSTSTPRRLGRKRPLRSRYARPLRSPVLA